jgi:tRNA(Arg) A34 adenosine deaminase TadA
MCAGAILLTIIGWVVYGLSQEGLYALVGEGNCDALHHSCEEILAKGAKAIQAAHIHLNTFYLAF